jgi:hypothetical protein
MIRTSLARPADVFPAPNEIVAFLDKHIVGQDDAKLALATAVYSHYLLAASAQGKGSTGHRKTANLLLAGPTGAGKSETVRWIAEYLDVPFVEMPATALTQEGYVGKKPEDIIRALLAAADWDNRRAEYGIVFVDEIDKIRRSGPTGSLDVSGAVVQMSLLPFLDGTTYSVPRGEVSHTVNTQHLLIVAAGAFQLPCSTQESRHPSDCPTITLFSDLEKNSMTTNTNDFRRPIVEHWERALAETQQHEERLRVEFEAAKQAHHDAKQQTKEIVSLLRICKRESGGGLTKETLRPYVTAVLNKTGPLLGMSLTAIARAERRPREAFDPVGTVETASTPMADRRKTHISREHGCALTAKD